MKSINQHSEYRFRSFPKRHRAVHASVGRLRGNSLSERELTFSMTRLFCRIMRHRYCALAGSRQMCCGSGYRYLYKHPVGTLLDSTLPPLISCEAQHPGASSCIMASHVRCMVYFTHEDPSPLLPTCSSDVAVRVVPGKTVIVTQGDKGFIVIPRGGEGGGLAVKSGPEPGQELASYTNPELQAFGSFPLSGARSGAPSSRMR